MAASPSRWVDGDAHDVRIEDYHCLKTRIGCDNIHPGDLLREDCLIGSELLPIEEVSVAIRDRDVGDLRGVASSAAWQ